MTAVTVVIVMGMLAIKGNDSDSDVAGGHSENDGDDGSVYNHSDGNNDDADNGYGLVVMVTAIMLLMVMTVIIAMVQY
jgi:hypothetical protein